MSSPYKFAVIGCGGIGNVHRACVAELENHGLAHLVAVADPYPSRYPLEAATLAEHGKHWYLDYREMLAKEDLDVVVVATPIHLHYEMAQACLAAGVRLLLEKPPVPLSAQLEHLIELDAEGTVWSSFQMLHSLPVQQAKALISSGALGTLRAIRSCGFWSRKTAYYQRAAWAGRLTMNGAAVLDGPATNALAHLLHNAMYLGTEEDGFTVADQVEAEFYRVRPIQSYDLLSIRARLASGVLFTGGFTHATHHSQPFYLEVEGSRGRVRIEEGRHEAITDLPLPPLKYAAREPGANPFHLLYRDFHAALRDDLPTPRTLLADARGYVQLTNGALVSSGGIRDVPASLVDTHGHGAETSYTVPGLDILLAEAVSTDRVLSELGAGWTSPALAIECGPEVDAAPLFSEACIAEAAAA
jgi:predicted dehydrogenase